ncbi:MAG: hypothetical protein ACI9DK_002544 [Vicingaceae bacterium]
MVDYSGDTLIQGKVFRKIIPTVNHVYFPNEFYLSEDVITGELFFYDVAFTQNQIVKISDFSLNVGDTLKSIGAIVDSVYLENSLKKKCANMVINNHAFTMIEGVGTNFGVNYRHMGLADGLLCQVKDNSINYAGSHATLNCNSTITSIKENALLENVAIRPNPASTYVELNLNGLGAKEIELLDVKGRLIKTFMNVENRLDISEIESGIYFLKVYLNKGFVSKKLMVAK